MAEQALESALGKPIQDLIAYADQHGEEDRAALFLNLVDLFISDNAPAKSKVRDQLLDLVKSLIPRISKDSRIEAVDRLVSVSQPPTDLVMVLAQDSAAIVGDLLRGAPFTEEEMLALVRLTTREHHQILASRGDLSANIWIALARAAPNGSDKASTHRPSSRATLSGGARRTSGGATITPIRKDTPVSAGLRTSHLRVLPSEPVSVAEADNSDLPPVVDGNEDGWCFRSNRDGFITGLSPQGSRLFEGLNDPVGQSLLDLLGLNAKLGHPIARAIQRRSSIHEAPLFVGVLPRGLRYWTLEATPRFNSATGSFDGYDALLSPVVNRDEGSAGAAQSDDLRAGIGAESIPSAAVASNLAKDPDFDDAQAEESRDVLRDDDIIPGQGDGPIIDDDADADSLEGAFAAVARSMRYDGVEQSISDFMDIVTDVSPDLPGDGDKGASETDQATLTPASDGLADREPPMSPPVPPTTVRDTAALVTMLEEAINAMEVAAHQGDAINIQLYADIARACTKALKATSR